MCKKRRLLISFVLLLGVAAGAYARDFEIDCGETYIVSGTESYGDMWCNGTLIVPTGAVLNLDDRSGIDGCDECVEATMATVIVEGEMYVTDRFDIGDDEDGQIIVRNGGIFVQSDNSDGFKLPDNSGGCHYIFVEGQGSLFRAVRIEAIPDRDAHIDLCDFAVLELENVMESPCYRHDPGCWIPDGTMTCCGSTYCGTCCGSTCELRIEYDVPVEGGATVTAWWSPCPWPKAHYVAPADGETGVKSAITGVVLEWEAACDVSGCPMCRHFVFFGTDKQAVEDAPIYEMGWVPGGPSVPPEYKGWLPGPVTCYNIGNLPLWSTFHWRIDEGSQGPIRKGDVWSFTTGCRLMAGDLNLDCLLNLEDYAILMTTWKEKQYFPWD
ncbi:MAG: hypothetical protein ACYS83_04680 [Planctomycetota bacterium]|jgi:hypothetical protein